MKIRPLRSVLYMPGSNRRALEKARTLAADGLILDLEDAVAPDAKIQARDTLVEELTRGGYGNRELVVRVNGLNTPWGADDITALAPLRADALLFPKIETADQVHTAIAAMEAAGADSKTALWIMAETPRGIINIEAIAGAHPRLSVIVMGTSDLAKEMRIPHTANRTGFLYSLSRAVLAARAHDLDILDGVYLDLQNDQGFLHACRQGVELGFDGKTLIHPKQLTAANETFAPSADAIAHAHDILVAWQEAQTAGKGVAVVRGKLVENLHVEEAKRTIAVAEAIKAME